MPEGPSIVILKEAVQAFKGKEVVKASGNTKKVDLDLLEGKTITDFKSWGKNFLICFETFTIRVHFMLFGSYRVNERTASVPRLRLEFEDDELNFYACSVTYMEEPLDEVYDWSADVMNPGWNAKKAIAKLKAHPDTLACDALLNQDIFAGVGNIIKNEVLFRIHVHPASQVGSLPKRKLTEMVEEAVHYSFQFLEWKKEFTLKKHWLAHTKKTCPRDHVPFHKDYLGKTHRRTFYCDICQKLYAP